MPDLCSELVVAMTDLVNQLTEASDRFRSLAADFMAEHNNMVKVGG